MPVDADNAEPLPRAFGWRSVYRVLLLFALPFVWLRLAWRSLRVPALRARWPERRGVLDVRVRCNGLWLHAVSAGEVIAAVPLLRALRVRQPSLPIFVTTTTHTGSERVCALLGDVVEHAYLPYDSPRYVARFLDSLRPRVGVLFETELWPSLLQASQERRIPIALLNARLSARSASRYAYLGAFTRRMLRQLRVVACQSATHAARFAVLGVPPNRLQVFGNLKFDLQIDADTRASAALLASTEGLHERHVWIAGSTHPGEEARVLDAHRTLRTRFPDALLILVPRHPERAAAVRAACVGFAVAQRSGAPLTPHCAVLIGDRMGELLTLYGAAQVAFVGGSLVDHGGHNPIEPAALGVPVVAGPYERNFEDVYAAFRGAGATTMVRDADTLAAAVAKLWTDAAYARTCVEAGHRVIAAEQGATRRNLALLEALLADGS